MRFLILLITCALLPACLHHAQTVAPALTGVVSDSAGQPLASAVVFVPGTDYKALTDAHGRFAFDSLPASTVKLQAAFIGYRSDQVDSVRTKPGQTTRVSFRLRTSLIEPGCKMVIPPMTE